ncbi:MAG: trypsin-like serine protease [Oligoflexus sp.]
MGSKYGSWLTWWTTAVLLLIPGMVQKCGQAQDPYLPRMVGGEEPGDSHPAAYSAVALVAKNSRKPFCSATIVADQLVVTAAHCIFKRRAEDIQIMFGRDSQDPNVKFIDAVQKDTFKKDQKYESNFDIGWVKLKRPIPEAYQPIEIWHDPNILAPGMPLLIAGYGRTSSKCGFNDPSCQGGKLLAVETEVTRYVNSNRLSSLIVIGSDSLSGPCFGDSGGPAYMNYDGEWFLIGDFMGWDKILVHEDVDTICDRGEGIYNYVGDYVHWIERSSGISLSFNEDKNPRQQPQDLPVLQEEPQTFSDWCLYNNHEDPAWYTVQRIIRIAAEGLQKSGQISDPSDAFTDCEIAWQTVETYIREEQSLRLVGFDPEQNIDYARLEDLRPLRTLSGLGLKTLILADHSIEDFSPIEDLTELETLEIIDNNFTAAPLPEDRISRPLQLSGLKQLRELRLNNANSSFDYQDLQELQNLQVLDLSFTEFPDLQLLDHKQLRELRLENVELTRSGSLLNLANLEVLVLRFVNVTAIPQVMPNLKTLHLWDLPHLEAVDVTQSRSLESLILYGLGLRQLPALSNFAQLKELAIIGNQNLAHIEGLGPLPLLETVEVIDNPLTNLGVIRDLPQLKELILHQNQLQSLDIQSPLPVLQNLEMTYNDLQSLEFLSQAPALQFLNISHNPDVEIQALQGLSKLERLAIENTKGEGLTSLTSLRDLPNLKEVNVKGNSLKSLNELLVFPDIEVILASNNMITDVSMLGELKKLDYLEVIDNPIENKDCPIEDHGGFCRFEFININI